MQLKDSHDSVISKRKKKNHKWSKCLTLEVLIKSEWCILPMDLCPDIKNDIRDYGEICINVIFFGNQAKKLQYEFTFAEDLG